MPLLRGAASRGRSSWISSTRTSLLAVLGLLVERDQRLGRGQVCAVASEHALEGAHGAVGLAELVAVEDRDLGHSSTLVASSSVSTCARGRARTRRLALRAVEALELAPAFWRE
jgi:hypothetical protein